MQMPVVLDTLRMRKAKNSAIRRRLASRNRWNLQTQQTNHQGTARASRASHWNVSPVCSNKPARDVLPYSARNERNVAASATRGRDVALISMGRRRPPVSITKSTSSPVVVRQYRISVVSVRPSRQHMRSWSTMLSRCAPPGSGMPDK